MAEPIDLTDYSFYTVAKVDELPPGERLFVEIGDISIVVFNIAGKLYAIGDVCTHDDGPLGDGELDGHEIICPRHGARFDVRSGKVLSLPAVVDIPTYPVRITEDDIEVGVPD
ncbi:MAG: non-heme iron oxygenase ferredoxin subunit [Chloroflexota bacterium]